MKLHGVSDINELVLLPYIIEPITNGLKVFSYNNVWDPIGLQWVKMTQPSGGGGTVNQGSPGSLANGWPVKITDGTNVLGTIANPLVTSATFSGSVTVVQPTGTNLHTVVDSGTIGISGNVTVTQSTGTNLHTVLDSGVVTSITNPVAVTGTFWQAIQPVSQSGTWNVGLNAGSNIIGSVRIDQTTPGTTNHVFIGSDGVVTLAAGSAVIGHVIVDSGAITVSGSVTVSGTVAISGGTIDTITNPVAVTGTFWQATQPVSGTVTSDQGLPNTLANAWPVEITDGTNILGTLANPIRVDPTGTTTQPVSGNVTATITSTPVAPVQVQNTFADGTLILILEQLSQLNSKFTN